MSVGVSECPSVGVLSEALSSRTTVRMMRIDIITMLIRSKACVLLRFLGDFVW